MPAERGNISYQAPNRARTDRRRTRACVVRGRARRSDAQPSARAASDRARSARACGDRARVGARGSRAAPAQPLVVGGGPVLAHASAESAPRLRAARSRRPGRRRLRDQSFSHDPKRSIQRFDGVLVVAKLGDGERRASSDRCRAASCGTSCHVASRREPAPQQRPRRRRSWPSANTSAVDRRRPRRPCAWRETSVVDLRRDVAFDDDRAGALRNRPTCSTCAAAVAHASRTMRLPARRSFVTVPIERRDRRHQCVTLQRQAAAAAQSCRTRRRHRRGRSSVEHRQRASLQRIAIVRRASRVSATAAARRCRAAFPSRSTGRRPAAARTAPRSSCALSRRAACRRRSPPRSSTSSIASPFEPHAEAAHERRVPRLVGHLAAARVEPGDVLDVGAADARGPGRTCAGAAPAARCRKRISRRVNSRNSLLLGRQVPVGPADLVVLAVGVVVAALRLAELVAAADHRHALREQQRRHEVALLPLAQLEHAPDRRSGPSTPQFQLRLWFSPSRLSSPLASLCFSL